MDSAQWNPWHGCKKISPGCLNCYVYRMDAKYGRDSSVVQKTGNFRLPVMKDRRGEYKLKSGEEVATCFSSDFFVDDADSWRAEAWSFMRERSDLRFLFITKRIDRFYVGLPDDWNDGYQNVTICCTVENQTMADKRLPIFLDVPIKHKCIVMEPLLGKTDISPYLNKTIELVSVGGESGCEARICNYDWVLDIRRQCMEAGVPFRFRQTGAKLLKDGVLYCIKRQYQHSQAKQVGINFRSDF